jgi:type IV secretion system protein VirD4
VEHLLIEIMNLCFEYKWVIAAAILIIHFMPADDDAEKAVTTNFKPDNAHGAARFVIENKLLKGLFGAKGIHVGYSPDGKRKLFYPGAGHLFLCAAARTGKGATLLVNALLEWKHSVVVFDPKAELSSITGHFRRMLGTVYVLNPLNIQMKALKGLKQACFNPMAILDPLSISFHALCAKIAAVLVINEEGKGKHFSDAARELLHGIIAALVRHGDETKRNLVEVARIVSSGDGLFRFCRDAMQSGDPYIIQKLQRFAITPTPKDPVSDEIRDVVATATTNLGFITGGIAESLKGSDFRFADLKRKPGTSVYICLPLSTLDVSDKYFRLLLDCFLADLLEEGQRGRGKPVLAIVDEMAQIGPHMKSLENAMGMAAGAAGLQLWCVLQDLSQLKGMFPHTWETFIQNCGVTMWFGARDDTTRKYISALAGTTEVLSRGRNASENPNTGEVVINENATQMGRPLILPEEAGTKVADDQMIMFVEGVNNPIKAKRKFYFACPEYRGKYRDNPYFKKR